jgi:hypothetical protein
MTTQTGAAVHEAVERLGFAFVRSNEMAGLLGQAGKLADWDEFAASWNGLALDTYMKDGGSYRRRRHAVYQARPDGAIVRAPDQPHYQSLDYNALNGGVARWFEPIMPAIAGGEALTTILACARRFFEALAANRRWRVEVHQFRIEARAGQAGKPTPEGIHRDGVDWVLVLLINRVNVRSGTTVVHALDGRALGSFTLTSPLDAAFLDDHRVAHGVTPVEPERGDQPAYRDVLVVTWAAER